MKFLFYDIKKGGDKNHMGLTISHNAFDGSYSAFNRFRQFIAQSIDASYPPHRDKEKFPDSTGWYWDTDFYSEKNHPDLFEFFCHSDCDGLIDSRTCLKLYRELEEIRPRCVELAKTLGTGGGHLERDGGYIAVLDRFMAGCKLAGSKNEYLRFI